jgi:hypothetical protein
MQKEDKIQEYITKFNNEGYVFLKSFLSQKIKKKLKTYLASSIKFRINNFIGKNNLKPTLFNFYKAWIRSGKLNYDRRSLLHYSVSEDFYNLVLDEELISFVRRILRTNEIYLSPVSNVRYKSSLLPWSISRKHRDQDYWVGTEKKGKKMNFVTFWLPLTIIDKNSGSLSIYKGKKKINFSARIGDLIVFNPYILHDADRSRIKKITSSLDIRFEEESNMTIDTSFFNVCVSSDNNNKIISLKKFLTKKPKNSVPLINNSNPNTKSPSGLRY